MLSHYIHQSMEPLPPTKWKRDSLGSSSPRFLWSR